MKNSKVLFIMIFFFFFSFCSKKNICDKEFRNMYFKAIQSIEIDYTHSIEQKTPYNINNSHVFLGHITNHFSQRRGTHFGLMYLSKEDYNYDISAWNEWYRNNGCYFSMKKADSVFIFLNLEKGSANSWKEYLQTPER